MPQCCDFLGFFFAALGASTGLLAFGLASGFLSYCPIAIAVTGGRNFSGFGLSAHRTGSGFGSLSCTSSRFCHTPTTARVIRGFGNTFGFGSPAAGSRTGVGPCSGLFTGGLFGHSTAVSCVIGGFNISADRAGAGVIGSVCIGVTSIIMGGTVDSN